MPASSPNWLSLIGLSCSAVEQTTNTAWTDQGYPCARAQQTATDNDIEFQIVKLPEADKGFVRILPAEIQVLTTAGIL